MYSLKIHDNFYSLEFLMNANTTVFTLAKLNYSTKYMLKGATEMLVKGKSSRFRLKQQSTRTTSTLLSCSTSNKVAPFLVFVVASMLFFSREDTCSVTSRRLPAQSE